MKNLLNLICTFLAVVSIAQTRTVVCGKITHPKGAIVKLSYWDGDMHTQTASLDKGGNFKIVTRIAKPIAHDIEHGEEVTHAFLSSGDSIYLTLDTKRFDEIVTYLGRGSAVNNYLAKQYLKFEDNLESETFQREHFGKIATLKPSAFLAYIDSVEAIRLTYLNSKKKDLRKTILSVSICRDCIQIGKRQGRLSDYALLHKRN
jgi:hypothetical protein